VARSRAGNARRALTSKGVEGSLAATSTPGEVASRTECSFTPPPRYSFLSSTAPLLLHSRESDRGNVRSSVVTPFVHLAEPVCS